jgi:hypothetical protein
VVLSPIVGVAVVLQGLSLVAMEKDTCKFLGLPLGSFLHFVRTWFFFVFWEGPQCKCMPTSYIN